MSATMAHERLYLENFTVFQNAEFEFSSGINAFVGENGTGKTHVMKAMYVMQLKESRGMDAISAPLEDLFQTPSVGELVRLQAGENASAMVKGRYGGYEWGYAFGRGNPIGIGVNIIIPKPERPVFIPAIDMMGHTQGFTEAYEEVRLDFDSTCRDIVNLLRLERRNGQRQHSFNDSIARLLQGEIERDDTGRFYLLTSWGRLPMPMVAEGLRKIATLVQLQRNGWLVRGTTLFWDEPEVNLNPILMDEVVGALITLARDGVQVFLATHSYVILKELDLQARKKDAVRYFGFQRSDEGTTVNSTDDLAMLQPNPILEQYDSLYDRELTRSTGRNRNGEVVR